MRILVALLMASLLLLPADRMLAGEIDVLVVDTTSGKSLLRKRMTDSNRFALRYHHSVEKCPVEEIYEIAEDGTIFLVETTVGASGYGLPECAPGEDCFTHEGRVTFLGLHYRIENLVMRVSYLNDMWLIFSNEDLNLRQVAPGGSRIVVQAQAAE